MVNTYFLIWLLTTVATVFSQCTINTQPFATATRTPSNINENTTKVYKTTLLLIPTDYSTSLNGSVFLTAATNFYENIPGFSSSCLTPIEIINNVSTPSGFVQVVYELGYLYTCLNSSTSTPDELVTRTIKNFTFVFEGLMNDIDFSSLYNISTDSNDFVFVETPLCTAISCSSSAFLSCYDDTFTSTCRSTCFSSYCYNTGCCHHSDPDITPICSCPSTSDSWYVGDRCESLLALWMMILFFVLVGILLILIPLITFCCYRNIDKKLLKEKQKETNKILKAKQKEKEAFEKAQAEKEKADKAKNESKSPENVDTADYSVRPTPTARQNIPSSSSENSFDEHSVTSRASSTEERQRSEHESTPGSIDPITVENQLDNHPPRTSNPPPVNDAHETTSSSSSSSSSDGDEYNYLRYDHPPSYKPPPSYVNPTSRYRDVEDPLESTV